MARVRVTPDAFELVYYDAAEIAALAERVADRVGVPADIEVSIEVDEALPRPLLGSYVDLVDGALSIWCSGGNFEDPHYPRRFSESLAGFELGSDLLRGADRLSPGFSEAPVDGELSDRRRAAWDVSARGRLTRLGFPVRESLSRYHFRLAHGFGDAADAVYDRLWGADSITWADIVAASDETEAVDPRPKPKARPGAKGSSFRIDA
ncbi:MAG TPA: hypothetical protein VFF40_05115 [Acidimicrobiia bacterium]|nr:hypothetical protein [Acidimicrobiia bacterium]